jgi:large subunit ribosomal protein L32
MAALALGPTRLFSLSNVFARPLFAGAALLLPSSLALPRPSTWTLPSLLDALGGLFPPILRAVPKKKVSHSRKAMRSANKGLKDKNSARAPGSACTRLTVWWQTLSTARRVVHQSWRTTCARAASRRSADGGSARPRTRAARPRKVRAAATVTRLPALTKWHRAGLR